MMSHYLRPGLPIRGAVSETACGKKAWRCNWTQHLDSVSCKQCRQIADSGNSINAHLAAQVLETEHGNG